MAASVSIADAVAITGAITGKAITEKEVIITNLTAAQKTAFVAFMQSLGTWPGGPGNVLGVSVYRQSGNVVQINCTVRGLIVYADLAAAAPGMNARTDEFVGVVP
jgi:hypothetical protein